MAKPKTAKCAATGCGDRFEPAHTTPWQLYCSTACRTRAGRGIKKPGSRTCAREGCGKTFRQKDARSKYCSKQCTWAVGNANRRSQTDSPLTD